MKKLKKMIVGISMFSVLAASTVPGLTADVHIKKADSALQRTELQQPNDPYFKFQWGLKKIGAVKMFDYLQKNNIKPKKKARLFILDSGIKKGVKDLEGILNLIEPAGDKKGHGTKCAVIAGAKVNNNLGIASLNAGTGWNNYFTITSVKITTKNGMYSLNQLIKSIKKAVDNNADVINISANWHIELISGSEKYKLRKHKLNKLIEVVQYAHSKGVLICASAGNDGIDTKHNYPSKIETVLCVAGTTKKDTRAYHSNYGATIDVAAPGRYILSQGLSDNFEGSYGTSFSCAYVSSLAAIIKAINPSLDDSGLRRIIEQTCDTISTDHPIGAGRINAYKAVKAAYDEMLKPKPNPLRNLRINGVLVN